MALKASASQIQVIGVRGESSNHDVVDGIRLTPPEDGHSTLQFSIVIKDSVNQRPLNLVMNLKPQITDTQLALYLHGVTSASIGTTFFHADAPQGCHSSVSRAVSSWLPHRQAVMSAQTHSVHTLIEVCVGRRYLISLVVDCQINRNLSSLDVTG